jgi:hypothetical protein
MKTQAQAMPHPAPGARTEFKLLVLFLISLQVLIVVTAARGIDHVNAFLRSHLPAASDTILEETPRAPATRMARA